MSTLRVDILFDYPAADGRTTRCGLRVYDQGDGSAVLVATDFGEAGPGVVDAIGTIASEACRRYGLDPERLTVLEHCDDRRTAAALTAEHDARERFARVAFARVPATTAAGMAAPADRFAGPAWTRLRNGSGRGARRTAAAVTRAPMPGRLGVSGAQPGRAGPPAARPPYAGIR